MRALAIAVIAFTLAACSGAPKKSIPAAPSRVESRTITRTIANTSHRSPYAPAQEDTSKRGNYTRGGLYAPEIQDSAPGGLPDVDLIPEPEVRAEPRSHYGNRSPYVVLGRSYSVVDDPSHYDEVGLASFYGNKFHGRRTSNLEVYDMYAFSAASKTLPLPSYARVTNLTNGRSVVVRVNDRGPFHEGRIIDLSYAAAVKLGVDRVGTARVQVQGLGAGDRTLANQAKQLDDASAARAAPLLPQLLPTDVHIATGKPVPGPHERPTPASAIDHLLTVLPIATADAGERSPQTVQSSSEHTAPSGPVSAPAIVPASTSQRFDMRQDGRTMTADEFDHWMGARRMRVATGKPGIPDKLAQIQPVAIAPLLPVAAPIASEIAPAPAVPAGQAPVSTPFSANAAVTLQVASFSARTNAEHALAMLTGAGIDGARLFDADANGRKVWRLRVGPVDPGVAQALVARIQGLGFGQPQRVHE